ncbi:pyrimidodiazepine synthase-like [Sitodiplosis mosellana]|uniref:pyrimidodiazepine synthase-like n=1 Tax=Sitodiplosis mosellana TaxID=263140 RepID=UPI0024445C39|nr:pyrimidodiazepine synthase-like [Sitodiplosis mosellana]
MSNTKHYRKGDEKPVFPNDGIYQLYSMRFCPYVARIHLVLDSKNIPYHTVNIHLNDKPDWLFEANPLGKVPALQLVDKPNAPFVYESLLIAEYLDEVHPQNKLYPSDPLAKLQEKIWIERFSSIASKFYNIVDGVAQWNAIQNDLDEFERELQRRGTTYFGGAKAGILDYAIWPWFQRTEVLDVIFGKGCTFSEERFPKLTKWYKTLVENDDAVKKYNFPKEAYVKYYQSRCAGAVDYDVLVQ